MFCCLGVTSITHLEMRLMSNDFLIPTSEKTKKMYFTSAMLNIENNILDKKVPELNAIDKDNGYREDVILQYDMDKLTWSMVAILIDSLSTSLRFLSVESVLAVGYGDHGWNQFCDALSHCKLLNGLVLPGGYAVAKLARSLSELKLLCSIELDHMAVCQDDPVLGVVVDEEISVLTGLLALENLHTIQMHEFNWDTKSNDTHSLIAMFNRPNSSLRHLWFYDDQITLYTLEGVANCDFSFQT